jgi:hypothetical protein
MAAALAMVAIAAPARDAGAAAAPGMVRGTVLDHRSNLPSIGRLVVVGTAQATTDINGRFAIAAPAGVYDITVVDPNRSSVTFYRGLRRRDPVLIHDGDPNLVPKGHDTHAAHIEGALSGGGFDPTTSNMASVYFFSPQVVRDKILGGPTYGVRSAGFSPLPLSWLGPASITGSLIAVRTTRDKTSAAAQATGDKGPVVWWGAHKDIKVASGEVTTADLTFARLPMGHIAGRIDVDPGLVVTGKGVTYYHLRNRGIPLAGDGKASRSTPFDYPVPDLRHLPGRYCANAYNGDSGVYSTTMKCGVALGTTDVTIRLHAPPKLTTPVHRPNYVADKPTISRDTQFTWTAFEAGPVHQLSLEGGPPLITVYTTATSTSWPDVESVGVPLPKVGDAYMVSVTGHGPYQGMDEAFSPTGIGMPLPKEAYSARSFEAYADVVPPGKPPVIPPAKQIVDDDGPPRRR